VRLDIRRTGSVKLRDEIVGNNVRVKVVKNKVAPPFRAAEFDILFNEGISREGALIDAAVEFGVIEKSGTWMSYGDLRLGQGRENVRNYLRENPTLAGEMDARVREKAAGQATAPLRTSVSVRTGSGVDDG
jgi:recombination protein RecA